MNDLLKILKLSYIQHTAREKGNYLSNLQERIPRSNVPVDWNKNLSLPLFSALLFKPTSLSFSALNLLVLLFSCYKPV